MSVTKTCTRCGQAYALIAFYARGNVCRACRRAAARLYEQRRRLQPTPAAPVAPGEPRPCVRCGQPFTPRVPSVEECRPCLLASVGVPIKRQGAER